MVSQSIMHTILWQQPNQPTSFCAARVISAIAVLPIFGHNRFNYKGTNSMASSDNFIEAFFVAIA
jgi:hypothetical protein